MDSCSPSTINYLIVQVCKAHRARTGELLSQLDMHPGQEMILVTLWREEELTLSELAERLNVRPPTVTRMVQRMEATGLVKRCACKSDQRVSHIRVTEKGKALEPKIKGIWETLEQEVTRNMTDEERLSFRRMLLQARENLQVAP